MASHQWENFQPPAIRLRRIIAAQAFVPRRVTHAFPFASRGTTTSALALVQATAKFSSADSTTIGMCVCGLLPVLVPLTANRRAIIATARESPVTTKAHKDT